MKEEAAKLEAIKKAKAEILSEGKCQSFDQFMSISEQWEDIEFDYETEVKPDIEIEEPEVIPGEGPENPPRRRVNPAPKNKYDELDDILDAYGEGPDCYGEGPGCGDY